jgi:cyclase
MWREMAANITGPWSSEEVEAFIAEREKTDPAWARCEREKLVGLRITLPTEAFEDRRKLEIGAVWLEAIHFDAHTPDSAVVWLPEARVLFASDLIFQGRYPYLFDADVSALIVTLKRLPEFGAQVIVPGHGLLCGKSEIAALLDYLETTWVRTADHLAQGHSIDEAVADANYPRYAERYAERLHVHCHRPPAVHGEAR